MPMANVTLANDLDYETTTSYEITIIASDGSIQSKETITINVSDVIEFAQPSTALLFLLTKM